MKRVNGYRVSNSCWRIAVLTTAAALGSASQAAAAIYYYPDSEPGFSRPAPAIAQQRRQKPRRQATKKIEAPVKEAAKPQGPLILSVSIQRQKLSIYDVNGFYAETPISTGMPGHPTPMGVFSVLEKEKMHHSNIYSGAPMPFMQRITWSGVAMHAGVLPGYPASHGCIRMPMAFAVKMYGWTRTGARVFVTPGDVTPASFSHPLLAAQKVVPQPVAADEPRTDAPTSAKADKAADATVKPETTEAVLELRPTVGHTETAQPVASQAGDATPLRDQTHTADASSALPQSHVVTMSDATTGAASPPPREAAAAANPAPATVAKENGAASADTKSEAAAPATTQSEAAKSEAAEPAKSAPEPAAAQATETASTRDKPVETKSADAATADARPAEANAAAKAETKADEAKAPMQPSSDPVKAEASATASTNPAETKTEARPDAAKPDAGKAETAQAVAPAASQPSDEKPAESSKPVTTVAPGPARVPDANKDQARLPDADKPAAPKPVVATLPAAKPNAQIAVFISRKDSKLYVRQNFTPLFSVPVTIAAGDRPLGTHVFTAQLDKNDSNLVHWSVVSLPVSLRGERREARETDDRHSRKRKVVVQVEAKPPPAADSPAEALDRITIPPEAMARITEALSTGSSITVSDQGIAAGETGEGTDFIVSLR
jgi:lipoprotein-anchoring transpeptidase ErfK/SrfK